MDSGIGKVSGTFFIIFLVIIAIVLISIFLYIYFKGKEIKKNSPKQRFKYLDTFYYHVFSGAGDDSDFNSKVYIVVCDIETSDIYAVPQTSFTNGTYEPATNSVLKGKGLRSNFKKVEYGDQGSLWIDKEKSNFYERNEELVKFGNDMVSYTKEKDKGFYSSSEMPKLHNIDNKNDVSLLDKAKFVIGIAEFDE